MLKNLMGKLNKPAKQVTDPEVLELRKKFSELDNTGKTPPNTPDPVATPAPQNAQAPTPVAPVPSQPASAPTPVASASSQPTAISPKVQGKPVEQKHITHNLPTAKDVKIKLIDVEQAEQDERMTNMIMEQIKELIEIDDNLNAKIKEINLRLDENKGVLDKIRELNDAAMGRMDVIEQNMERFLGLYEVVTNQYNPFVQGSAGDKSLDSKVVFPAKTGESKTQPSQPSQPVQPSQPEVPTETPVQPKSQPQAPVPEAEPTQPVQPVPVAPVQPVNQPIPAPLAPTPVSSVPEPEQPAPLPVAPVVPAPAEPAVTVANPINKLAIPPKREPDEQIAPVIPVTSVPNAGPVVVEDSLDAKADINELIEHKINEALIDFKASFHSEIKVNINNQVHDMVSKIENSINRQLNDTLKHQIEEEVTQKLTQIIQYSKPKEESMSVPVGEPVPVQPEPVPVQPSVEQPMPAPTQPEPVPVPPVEPTPAVPASPAPEGLHPDHEVHEDNYFWLPDGTPIKSLSQLIIALTGMDDSTFAQHATAEHNDFAEWTEHVLQKPTLASQLKGKNKEEMLALLEQEQAQHPA